jgi:activating signal cointegrator 1
MLVPQTAVYGLTLYEPWASLMARGIKRVETRSWAPPVPKGSIICVHAAARWDANLALTARVLAPSLWQSERPDTLGKILSVHRLADFQRVGHLKSPEEILIEYYDGDVAILREESLGDYTRGRWAWHLPLLARLDEPIAAVGRQRLWLITEPKIVRIVREAIDAVSS